MLDFQLQFPFNLLTILRLWLSVVMVMLCLASPAVASLSGSVEMIYSDFTAEEDGEEVANFSAFSQKYSVYFTKSGFVGDKRLGRYNVGLGYEWVTNSSKIKLISDDQNLDQDEEFNTDSGKVLFRGDLTIAPGGLPFRFDAYSYDRSPARYSYFNTSNLLDTQIIVGTRTREEVVSGMSLMAGIRNGSYLGSYRSILSKLPRIFIDYSQVFVRDVDGLFKEHHLTRDLAFVSLNKKDNWFHYRASEYTDYVDSDFDESSYTLLLGTIDHGLKRHWINMTNWIKLSVDASYYEEETRKSLLRDRDPKTFALNFFTETRYGKTRTSSFSNFSRTTTNDKLVKDYEIPVFANGWIDPNRSWGLQLRHYKYTENVLDQQAWFVNDDDEGEYLTARFGLGHQDAFKFDSTLELERADKSNTNAFAVRVRQEISRNVNTENPWLLGYTGLYINTDSEFTATDSANDVFEHELYGSSKWVVSPRSIFELRQNFRYANSVSTGVSTNYIVPKGGLGNSISESSQASQNSLTTSETSLSLDSRLAPKLTHRLLLNLQIFIGGVEDRYLSSLADELKYSTNQWRFEMFNGLFLGDDVPNILVGRQDGRGVIISDPNGANMLDSPNYVFSHVSSASFRPNRNLDSGLKLQYVLKDTDSGLIHRSSLSERSEYTFLNSKGGRRILGSVYQEVDYEMYSSDYSDASYLRLLVGASYYPTTRFELGGEMYYEWNDPQGDENIAFSVRGAMDFRKLSCETRYSYGVATLGSGPYDERKEHLFEAKIRKSF